MSGQVSTVVDGGPHLDDMGPAAALCQKMVSRLSSSVGKVVLLAE